ncbi:MAG: helix-turn-helix transcriptional regulator [Gammaproteobacteria bacterium]|nr:helix-turn-helix transcriptional regulator [Gammaproteobacteria bacterium]
MALEVFAELGYEGTSVREIARKLGVSHGLLNARFGSKHALWMAAVSYGMDHLHSHMARIDGTPDLQADLVEQMRCACRNFLLGLVETPAIIQLMNTEGGRRSERLDHIVGTFFRGRTWRIDTLLKQGQKQGVFRPVHTAVPFTLLAHGAGALVILRPLVEAVDVRLGKSSGKLMRAAEEAVDVLVRGLLTGPGPG